MENPDTQRSASEIDSQPQDDATNVPRRQPPTQVSLDDSNATSHYANFCRIAGTPEELILDFGLNPTSAGSPTSPAKVNQRIVTGWQAAKRIMEVLQLTVQRHEAAFGDVETNTQKRAGLD